MPSADPIHRTVRRRAACLLLLGLALHPAAQAEDVAAPAVAAPVPGAPAPQVTNHTPADLEIANRKIVTLRAPVFGATPAERVESVEERINSVVAEGGPLKVGTRVIPEGVAVQVDGRLIFRVLRADVDPESGETAAEAARAAAAALQLALDELREAHSSTAIIKGIGVTIVATALLLLALWLLRRAYAWAASPARSVRAAPLGAAHANPGTPAHRAARPRAPRRRAGAPARGAGGSAGRVRVARHRPQAVPVHAPLGRDPAREAAAKPR